MINAEQLAQCINCMAKGNCLYYLIAVKRIRFIADIADPMFFVQDLTWFIKLDNYDAHIAVRTAVSNAPGCIQFRDYPIKSHVVTRADHRIGFRCHPYEWLVPLSSMPMLGICSTRSPDEYGLPRLYHGIMQGILQIRSEGRRGSLDDRLNYGLRATIADIDRRISRVDTSRKVAWRAIVLLIRQNNELQNQVGEFQNQIGEIQNAVQVHTDRYSQRMQAKLARRERQRQEAYGVMIKMLFGAVAFVVVVCFLVLLACRAVISRE